MNFPKARSLFLLSLVLCAAAIPGGASAETKRKPAQETAKPATQSTATPPAEEAAPEEADIKKIREKYWARGNEAEVGVVQNRLFSKRNKIELGLDLQTVYGDPFLSTRSVTASVGYYFDELYSGHLAFSKAFVSPSSALTALERQSGQTANTNLPQWYLTAEGHANLLYGKVSLLGSSILHFDAYVSAGAGLISTESGSNFLVTAGIGQLLHLNRTLALSVAYKMMWYRERILGKVSGTNGNLGQDLGTRANLSSMMVVGLTIRLDPAPEVKPKTEATSESKLKP